MKFLFACGGTSGHINPALAIAGELRRRHPDAQFLFMGTPDHLEADLVPRAGYDFKTIQVAGLRRSVSPSAIKHNFSALSKFLSARKKVRNVIKTFQPDVVIGTGGYVSAPVLSEAAAMKRKTLIHEQNAFAGVTTKMLAPKVNRVLLSFPLAKPIQCDPEKCTVIGNPVKEEFLQITKENARAQLGIPADDVYILSYGGSLGARKINDTFIEMAKLASEDDSMTLCHGAARDYQYVTQALADLLKDHPRIQVKEYIYDMPLQMAAADVVVARSGAMTLTELAALGKPSILIPSPNVTENHQFFNAKTYSDINAAVLLEERELTGESLYAILCDLAFDKGRLTDMEKAAKTLSHPTATARICDEIEALLK